MTRAEQSQSIRVSLSLPLFLTLSLVYIVLCSFRSVFPFSCSVAFFAPLSLSIFVSLWRTLHFCIDRCIDARGFDHVAASWDMILARGG